MNILVSGGAGFIGANFIRRCLQDQTASISKIVNLDALTYAGNLANLTEIAGDQRYQFVHGDFGDPNRVSETLEKFKIEAIVNFAAESHVDRSIDSPESFFQTNVLGTLRFLNCTKSYWEKLPTHKRKAFRFLHVSTDEVYGSLDNDEIPWTEESPYKPNSPYAASKAASDHIIRAFYHTYQLPIILTNCSNNYGPYQFPEKLIPLMILNALEGRSLPIYGDGLQVRDWLYVDDHVDALWLALNKGRLGERYNIGASNECANIDIVKRICLILDKKKPSTDGQSYITRVTHVFDRLGHDRRYAINSTKIRSELGWSPKEIFDSGIEKTIHWYLNNRQWAADITSSKYDRHRLGTNRQH